MRFLSVPLSLALMLSSNTAFADPVSLGPRPFFLVNQMEDGPLKTGLPPAKTSPPGAASFRSPIAERR